MVRHVGKQPIDTPAGTVVDVRGRLYTRTFIQEDDQVTYNGVKWRVETVQSNHVLMGNLGYYDCTIIKLGYSTS